MNTLLVYPQYPDTFWSFKHVLKFVSKKAAYPPLGLLTIAAMLPKEWNKKLIDVNVCALRDEDIIWAEMVFISAMLVQQESTKEIIKRCKALDRIVAAGGPAFTTQYENMVGVDYFILNEAEITLPLFLEDLKNGQLKQLYGSRERPDIAKTSKPLWSLINLRDYMTMAVQYSRGCPFNCEFCDIIVMNGRTPRVKTSEQFIGELQSLYEAGWRDSVFVVDDNFIGNKASVKKMLPELIRWQKEHNYPFKLFTETSVNLADDNELMKKMSAANFYRVFLGLETPSIEGLKECGKTQNTTRNLVESVKIIQQNGLEVMGGFIVGFDSDKESIFKAQIEFIQQIGVVMAMVGLLTAMPQTRLWHRLKTEGRLLAESTGENTDGGLNFIPKMGREKLIKGYKKILETIYSPKCYYERIGVFVKHYKPTVKGGRINKEDTLAFLKSMWIIGVLSKARLRYWSLIIKTILTKTKALPVAVALAIAGLHFERTTKKIIK